VSAPEVDLSGVDPSHCPGLAVDNIFSGLVYCMTCGRLLTGIRAGLTRSGSSPCTGPLGVRPCYLEPIEDFPKNEAPS
jgi:hypothetical protein